jgi:DNA ligase 1
MKLAELVQTSALVAATPSRLEKIALLRELLRRLPPDEVPIAIGFLTGWPRQGRLGAGWASVSAAMREGEPATIPTLELAEADAIFDAVVSVGGRKSNVARARLIADLFIRATDEEQRFLGALMIGEVRQGALEGLMLEAVAAAADVPAGRLRRAVMLAGDLGSVAQDLLQGGGAEALAKYGLVLFRPVQPMLADSAGSIEEAVASDEPMTVEWKIDGARIQVHREDERVAIYTRNLNDVTLRLPEVVEAVLGLPARELILDGEVIALAADGRPRSFQTTMRRFGRRLDIDGLRDEIPLTPFFFDVLLHDRESVLDEPLATRLEILDRILPAELRVPRIDRPAPDEAARFETDTRARGHEGVMVKALSAPYAAGRRGAAWRKVKAARTLDLVVLAAEWGSGRRTGWLSNLHLGARDPETDGFVMLGKTFKGMTDEMLAWQTKELLAREVRRDGHVVFVHPELVVEIAFNEVQRSRQYPGGATLRFARVKGYRPDRSASDADTIETVRAFLD